ncbi:MAG: hypothetical protein ACPGNT_05390 [Rhodospirillales bacterium]
MCIILQNIQIRVFIGDFGVDDMIRLCMLVRQFSVGAIIFGAGGLLFLICYKFFEKDDELFVVIIFSCQILFVFGSSFLLFNSNSLATILVMFSFISSFCYYIIIYITALSLTPRLPVNAVVVWLGSAVLGIGLCWLFAGFISRKSRSKKCRIIFSFKLFISLMIGMFSSILMVGRVIGGGINGY